MTVISFATSKGGAGKTTSCIVIGTILAEKLKVTIIDADPAGRVIRWSKKGDFSSNITVKSCFDEDKIMDVIEQQQAVTDVVLVDLEGVSSLLNNYTFSLSDLVIVPMGDEAQDAEDAIDTLKQIKTAGRSQRREIPARILFSRTKAAVKARLEKSLNAQMRANVPCFETELKARTAYSNLHSCGGGLDTLPKHVSGVDKATDNARAIAAEIIEVIKTARTEAVA